MVLPRTVVRTARKGKLYLKKKISSVWSKLGISALVFKRQQTDRQYAVNKRVRDLVEDKNNTFSDAFPLCSFILKAFRAPIIQDNTHRGLKKS